MKSIRQAPFKLPHSQPISCIGYNVNLQTAVAAILITVKCLKSISSEVLVVLKPYQNLKSIRQTVFKLQRSQAISCIRYNVNLQTAVVAIFIYVECPKSIASQVLSKCEVYLTSGFQATAFTSNILYRVQCSSLNCCGGHLDFGRIPQINSVRGLSGIKVIS